MVAMLAGSCSFTLGAAGKVSDVSVCGSRPDGSGIRWRYVPPVFDTVEAAAGTATAIYIPFDPRLEGLNRGALAAVVGIVAAGFAASAVYGYTATQRCPAAGPEARPDH